MLFEKRIQYINRYREIAMALSKSGFGFILEELGLDEFLSLPKRLLLKQNASIEYLDKTRGVRIRHLLETLGPTFVKLGQIASTRRDFFTPDIINELEKLQDNVSPMPYDVVKRRIEASLGTKVEDIFSQLDENPIGSASIGQVHKGILKTGQSVAIKVQRPNIEKTIRNDLEILNHLSSLADSRMELARQYQIKHIIEEFSREIVNELDYTIESQNQEKIAKQFESDHTVKIPEIVWELTTKEVLVMEYIHGINVNEHKQLVHNGHDLSRIAEKLTQSLFHQILIEGFFHGDPHPGNIKILPDERICYMDFGMVGRLSPDMKNQFSLLVIALMRKDVDGVVRAITKLGAVPEDADMVQLRKDAEILRDKYYDVPLAQMNIGDAIDELFNIANKHRIILPSDFTILAKSILTMEGIVTKLDKSFSIIDVAEPFGKELLKERFNPKHISNSAVRNYYQFSDNVEDITSNLHEFTKGLRDRKLPINLHLDTEEKMLRRFDKLGNRLSFSIILLAFSIIMVGLLISSALSGQDTLLFKIPLIEIVSIVAVILFIGMFISILKSGRL